jgi:hypothetical protein
MATASRAHGSCAVRRGPIDTSHVDRAPWCCSTTLTVLMSSRRSASAYTRWPSSGCSHACAPPQMLAQSFSRPAAGWLRRNGSSCGRRFKMSLLRDSRHGGQGWRPGGAGLPAPNSLPADQGEQSWLGVLDELLLTTGKARRALEAMYLLWREGVSASEQEPKDRWNECSDSLPEARAAGDRARIRLGETGPIPDAHLQLRAAFREMRDCPAPHSGEGRGGVWDTNVPEPRPTAPSLETKKRASQAGTSRLKAPKGHFDADAAYVACWRADSTGGLRRTAASEPIRTRHHRA